MLQRSRGQIRGQVTNRESGPNWKEYAYKSRSKNILSSGYPGIDKNHRSGYIDK